MAKDDGVTMIVMSGDMDKVFAALTIAIGAAAAGRETSMFFTFWGVKAIQKGNFTGKSLFGRMVGIMNRGGINRIGPSRFNFWGIGRWMFKKTMRDKGACSLSALLQMAFDLKIAMYACKTTMDIMQGEPKDLLDGVTIAGVATMVKDASESQVQFFI